MQFYDMDGQELHIGDYIEPVVGPKHRIVSVGRIQELPDEVMFGQQVENMAVFAILTKENLAEQFRKI